MRARHGAGARSGGRSALLALLRIAVMIWGGHATFVVALAAAQSPSRAIAFQQAARSSYVFGFLVSGVYAVDAALVLAGFAAAVVGLSEEREAAPASAVAMASASWVARRAVRFATSYIVLVAPLAFILLALTGPQKEVLSGVVAPGNACPRCQSWEQAVAAALGLQSLGDASLRQQCVPWAFPASLAGWASLLVVAAVAGSNGLALALDTGAARLARRLPALRPWLARLSARRLTPGQYERLAREDPGRGGGGVRGHEGVRDEAAAFESAVGIAASAGSHRDEAVSPVDEQRAALGARGSSGAGVLLRRRQPTTASGQTTRDDADAAPTGAATAGGELRRPAVSLSFSPRGVAWALLASLFASLTLARAIGRPLGAEAKTLSLEAGAAPEAQTVLRARLNLWSLAPAAAAGAMASFGLGAASSSRRRVTRLEAVSGAAALLLVVALGLSDWYALAMLAPQSQLGRSAAAALYRPCLTLAWAVALRLAVRVGAERTVRRWLRNGRAEKALHALAAGVTPASLIQPLLAIAAVAVPGASSLGLGGATLASLACSAAGLLLALPVTVAGRAVSRAVLPAACAGEDGVLGDGATIGRVVLAAGVAPDGEDSWDADREAGAGAGAGEGLVGDTSGLAGRSSSLTPADRAFLSSRAALLGVAGLLRVDVHLSDDFGPAGRQREGQGGATASAAGLGGVAGLDPVLAAATGVGVGDVDSVDGASDEEGSDDAASESGASSNASSSSSSSSEEEDEEESSEDSGEGDDEDSDSAVAEPDDVGEGPGQSRLEAVARALRLLCAGDALQAGGVERLSELCVAWEEETGATAGQAIAVLRLASDGAVQEAAELGIV